MSTEMEQAPRSQRLVTLACHPQTRTEVVRGVAARVCRSPGGVLAVSCVVDADLGRLRIPPPRPPSVVHGLWEHTCFEIFIAMDNTPGYHELNFAPSGEWALYAFHRYREIAALPDRMPAAEMIVRRQEDRFELEVLLRLHDLSAMHASAALRIGLAAVVEDESGALSYWALHHPAGKPDFHHPDAFALRVEVPGVDSCDDPG